jgi:hypothetical protein
MTLFWSVLSVACFIAGVAFIRGRTPTPAPTPRASCDCEHPMGSHVDGSGECVAAAVRPRYNDFGRREGHEYAPCPCMAYNGPRPVESFYPTPMLPPTREDRS